MDFFYLLTGTVFLYALKNVVQSFIIQYMVWVCFFQCRASLSPPPIAGVHVHAVQVIEVVVIVVIIIVVVAVDNINQIQNCVDRYHCESQKTKQCKMLNIKHNATLNVLL